MKNTKFYEQFNAVKWHTKVETHKKFYEQFNIIKWHAKIFLISTIRFILFPFRYIYGPISRTTTYKKSHGFDENDNDLRTIFNLFGYKIQILGYDDVFSDNDQCPHCGRFISDYLYSEQYFKCEGNGQTNNYEHPGYYWYGIQTCPYCRHKYEVGDSTG